jgi:hypothetical protein
MASGPLRSPAFTEDTASLNASIVSVAGSGPKLPDANARTVPAALMTGCTATSAMHRSRDFPDFCGTLNSSFFAVLSAGLAGMASTLSSVAPS